MKIQANINYEDLISVENLFVAWQEFIKGKRNKPDVKLFAHALIDNILQLHNDLANRSYAHGGYQCFNISDPKPRSISKASVRDRLLHHAIYRKLYPFFDKTFIADSYSCRINKGTHKAIDRFQNMYNKVSKNNNKTCWVLKCDIRKFFASINHEILVKILTQYIPDKDILCLLQNIIKSFSVNPGKGLPLGNLTSQLFVNVYMNEFDQFAKHKLKIRNYIRYADDFVILSVNKNELVGLLNPMSRFLKGRLDIFLHPDKVFLSNFASGIDFLGWVNFPKHRILRTTTKKHMFRRIEEFPKTETLQSYLGLLEHGHTAKLRNKLLNNYWLFRSD